ncbi:MAG: ATP-binding cassette domain-containing protein [Alsobacter sp.]
MVATLASSASSAELIPRPRGARLAFDGVDLAFGARRVLERISLTVAPGAFVAVVGRSGCGKSTLLRLLAGLDEPTGGSLAFAGLSDEARRAQSRLMFQEPRLLPWARVIDNVAVGLGRERGTPAGRARVLEVLAAVGLEDRASDWPSVLSGGQRQRVALARALVSRPRYLALDEPLGALDALTRIEMQSLLEQVWREQGFTAILVTHDVSEALTLADRVIIVADGTVDLDIAVDLPRPRRRGNVALARLEEEILGRILREDRQAPDYVI